MADLGKLISQEGAEALRELAKAMPFAIGNISEATERMNRIYESVAEGLGVKQESFRETLVYVSAAKEKAAEALEYLPTELEKTAAEIENYIASNFGITPGN